MRRFAWQSVIALLLCVAGAAMLPLANAVTALPFTIGQTAAIELLLVASVVISMSGISRLGGAIFLLLAVHVAAFMLVGGIAGNEGAARPSFFLLLGAAWFLAWRLNVLISRLKLEDRAGRMFQRFAVPALFGLWILILWEGITRGAGIPFVLLPPPTAIAARFANSLPILAADVEQTVLKAVLAGYLIGCASGFVVAILADRVPFLRKGLLPIGNLVSALPVIGIAPIMVMWFGFDWPSKAAVVVVMTFFPMLVNTVAGLAASGHMERDLMRTYASNYWQTLFKLRLPAAAPFIFNALKINSTLALIGAIVAEFFGTPIVGMGFRISTEVGRMNVDMVWAEIAVAAVAGSIFYGVVAFIERVVTFWHPSIRGG
jgi:NitT/TauT family transport system permease protein